MITSISVRRSPNRAPHEAISDSRLPCSRATLSSPASLAPSTGYSKVGRSEHKDMVKDVFEKVAPKYDVMNDFMSFFMHRMWKDRFVSTLHPFAGQKHLDVAGGTGDVGFRVLKEIRKAEEAFVVQQNQEYPVKVSATAPRSPRSHRRLFLASSSLPSSLHLALV